VHTKRLVEKNLKLMRAHAQKSCQPPLCFGVVLFLARTGGGGGCRHTPHGAPRNTDATELRIPTDHEVGGGVGVFSRGCFGGLWLTRNNPGTPRNPPRSTPDPDSGTPRNSAFRGRRGTAPGQWAAFEMMRWLLSDRELLTKTNYAVQSPTWTKK
jgi:hypothetical protein